MQFTVKALLDDEDTKQVRDVILGQSRAIARNVLDDEFRAELERMVAKLRERYSHNDWLLKGPVKEVLKEIISQAWGDIAIQIDEAADSAVEAALQKKLKNNPDQDTYIRKMVRKELADMLTKNKD